MLGIVENCVYKQMAWPKDKLVVGTKVPFLFIFYFYFLISLIADGPHHYHPACGHKGSSHLSPVHALEFLSRCKFSTLTTRQPMVETSEKSGRTARSRSTSADLSLKGSGRLKVYTTRKSTRPRQRPRQSGCFWRWQRPRTGSCAMPTRSRHF